MARFLPYGLDFAYSGRMALNIKDPETDRLARELAAATGEKLTVAVRVAIQERLNRTRRTGTLTTNLDDIIARGRKRRTDTSLSEAEILGLDSAGLPQ